MAPKVGEKGVASRVGEKAATHLTPLHAPADAPIGALLLFDDQIRYEEHYKIYALYHVFIIRRDGDLSHVYGPNKSARKFVGHRDTVSLNRSVEV